MRGWTVVILFRVVKAVWTGIHISNTYFSSDPCWTLHWLCSTPSEWQWYCWTFSAAIRNLSLNLNDFGSQWVIVSYLRWTQLPPTARPSPHTFFPVLGWRWGGGWSLILKSAWECLLFVGLPNLCMKTSWKFISFISIEEDSNNCHR